MQWTTSCVTERKNKNNNNENEKKWSKNNKFPNFAWEV
jgi:hypothetical protein